MMKFDVGFVPLTDCASLVVAKEKGFAAAEGLDLNLHKQPSWAAVRDKVAFGRLDAAHLPAGLAMALSLGLGGEIRVPMVAPIALGQGGNAITVSTDLYQEMTAADPDSMAGPRAWTCQALAKVVHQRKAQNRPMLRLGVVYPFSSHNYELRYWLAAANVHADQDVELMIVPPPRMVDYLQRGLLDGFCVGEPWNQVAVREGLGCVIASKADLWPASLEKVLALRQTTAQDQSDSVAAMVRALLRASAWADDPENAAELTALLALEAYIGLPAEVLRLNIAQTPLLSPTGEPVAIDRYQVFHTGFATVAWPSQARWMLAQMRRWGHAPLELAPDAADAVFDNAVYSQAAKDLGLPVPKNWMKQEASHHDPFEVATTDGGMVTLPADAVFDDLPFDPFNFSLYERQLNLVTKPERHYGRPAND